MSYTPTQWQTGDTVTAEKLNKMEQGIETAVDPFIVNLTPTAQDFSGVMDKTVAEITAAHEAGRKIVFNMATGVNEHMEMVCNCLYYDQSTYPSFNNYIVIDNPLHALIYAFTHTTNIGEDNIYSTVIYPLTPMSN